jgi:hypothetical protein
MTVPTDDFDEDKPLDPAMERVRRKLARLMVVSIGIMLIGLMAVLGAVVYKSAGSGAPQMAAEAVLALPDGFSVTDTAVSDTRILFLGEMPGGETRVLIYDAQSGALLANHGVQ